MERLKHIKESLIACAESQLNHLEDVDAEELGEVIDMIKDIEEAVYYCTITKAMEEYDENPKGYYYPPMNEDKMYYGEYKKSKGEWKNDKPWDSNHHEDMRDMEYPIMRDRREGRSPVSRKMYMEHRETHSDKALQMKELETYMQELTQDIVEMIEGASPEEK
jgi:hypothetical protein